VQCARVSFLKINLHKFLLVIITMSLNRSIQVAIMMSPDKMERKIGTTHDNFM
jgi:hypothetical protein